MNPSDLNSVRKALSAAKDKVAGLARNRAAPCRFQAAGKTVHCPHCGGGRFHHGTAQLTSRTMNLLGLDFLNAAAHTLMCAACGRIEWFGHAVEKVD